MNSYWKRWKDSFLILMGALVFSVIIVGIVIGLAFLAHFYPILTGIIVVVLVLIVVPSILALVVR